MRNFYLDQRRGPYILSKVEIFWAISAVESQKVAEDSHNKENINVLREFILHQQNLIIR